MSETLTAAPACAVPSPDAANLGPAASTDLRAAYTWPARAGYMTLAVLAGLLVAGFWNASLADGFGREVVAGHTIGDSAALSGSFAQHGIGFGFLFGAVAGLAATFTACNCVVFALLPGLAANGAGTPRPALHALALFTGGVLVVSAVYGMFIGFLGPDGIVAFNTRAIRLAQASTVFSVLGTIMLIWGALELGFLDVLRRRVSPDVRAMVARPATKAALLGLMVGTFSIGRPFPVMRDLLAYAATAHSPVYGAGVMMMQGLGQIALMVLLLLAMVYGFGSLLTRWVRSRPHQVTLTSALALVAGGTFFVYYWGLALTFDIGRWGFKLGIY
jgi:cytochrome c biogenesis protein CcdA